jgi:hypothetical protein
VYTYMYICNGGSSAMQTIMLALLPCNAKADRVCRWCNELELDKHIRKCPARKHQEAQACSSFFSLDINLNGAGDLLGNAGVSLRPSLTSTAERTPHSYQLGVTGMRHLFERFRAAAARVCALH